MNVLLTDYNNPDRINSEAKTSYDNEELQGEIETNFNNNLYRDIGDLYATKNSQRQFYTTANTKIPNDQDKFADWLYKQPMTCKEGNGHKCINNISNTVTSDTPFSYRYI